MRRALRCLPALVALAAPVFTASSTGAQGPIFPPYTTFVVSKQVVAGTVVHLPLHIIDSSQRGWAYEVILPQGIGEIDYEVYYARSQTAAGAQNIRLRTGQMLPVHPIVLHSLPGAWYGVLGDAGVGGATYNNLAMVVTTNLIFPPTPSVKATDQKIRSWVVAILTYLMDRADHYAPART